MDVGTWLRNLGLGQYEQAFRENDIDAEVVADLTADDLIGLGITSVGHRRKLLAAIAALRAGSVQRLPLHGGIGHSRGQPRRFPRLSGGSSR